MTRKHLICLIIFSFIYYSSYPQEFGGNPPSTKWNQINSPNARIIFSKSSDSIAQKINSILIGLSDEEDDERLLISYDRIRKNYRNGLAVVPVERDSCGGCYNAIPPQKQSDIKQRKKIIVCENCGRIIVDDELNDSVEVS
jgi:hypothetical protein